jgi:hypothetical protein
MSIKLQKYSAGSYGYKNCDGEYFITNYMGVWVLSASDELEFDARDFATFTSAKTFLKGWL